MLATSAYDRLAPLSQINPLKALLSRVDSEVTSMCAETDATIRTEIPELTERFDEAARYPSIEATIRRALRRLAGHTDPDPSDGLHRVFGAAAAYAGMPVEQLAAGIRVGAQIGWAHICAAARDLQVDAELALLLADAQVAIIHELTAEALDGYAEAAVAVQDHHSRERQSFIDALMAGRATENSARSVRWPWPRELAVAVIHNGDREVLPSSEVLTGVADGTMIALGPPDAVERALARVEAATIGPTVVPAQARLSFERARRLANLVTTGVLTRQGAILWSEELSTIIVHSAPDAAEELADRRLAPLRDPSPDRQRMLYETLAAWLDHPGQPLPISRALQLHPQSARYRLARLRERLGDDLDDPNIRFELALALRYRTANPTAQRLITVPPVVKR